MLGRHLLQYLPVNLAQAVVGFGGVYVLTRMLSLSDYGVYAQALAASSILNVIASLWLEAAAARFHARAEARGRLADHIATLNAALAPVTLGLLALVALAAWLAPVASEIRTLIAFAGGALVLRMAMRVFQETRRAAHETRRYAALETFYTIGAFSLGVGLIAWTPLHAAGPFAGMLVAALVCVALEVPHMAARGRGGKADGRRAAYYARYGYPIAISQVLVLLIATSDRFLISYFLGADHAGAYAAGYALADRTLNIMFLWVGMAAGPIAVALLEKEGRESARASLKLQAETLLLLTLPAAVGLALVARPLAAVMTGEDFRAEAAIIVPWIAAAGFLSGFTTYYLDQALELSRKTHLFPFILAAPAAANLGLNLVLLPMLGMTGAVISTVVAYGMGAILTFAVGRRHFPLPLPLRALLRTGAACAAMAAAVLLLPHFARSWTDLLVQAAVGGAVYAAAALAFDAGPARTFAREALRLVRPARLAEAVQ